MDPGRNQKNWGSTPNTVRANDSSNCAGVALQCSHRGGLRSEEVVIPHSGAAVFCCRAVAGEVRNFESLHLDGAGGGRGGGPFAGEAGLELLEMTAKGRADFN